MARPKFDKAWAHFAEVYKHGSSDADALALVAKKIGGKVKANIDAGIFTNACPIRMSYVLNYGGVPVPKPTPGGAAASSGDDRKWYMFRVLDMIHFLENIFGNADVIKKNKPVRKDFAHGKGIIAITGHGWSDAVGHVTLWDGFQFSDKNHLGDSSDNGTFVPEVARLWKLP